MPQWTPDQKAAIEADGGTLLVTAAAGSGKTSVLTHRIVRLITEKKIDIDRLLVVTFTRAAASEMRERIAESISALLAQNPSDRHLARQQMLLNRANISTVHSFCSSFIRENFRKANVECDFRLLDEGEYKLLKAEVLDALLEQRYTERDEGFMALADMLSADRSDAGLRNCVQNFMDFLSASDGKDSWLDRMEQSYSDRGNVDFWEKRVLECVSRELRHCILLTEAALRCAKEDEDIEKAYAEALKDDLFRYNSISEEIKSGDVEKVSEAADFVYARLGTAKTQNVSLKDTVKARRDKAKKKMTDLRVGLLSYTRERIVNDICRIRPAVTALVKLLRDYFDALTEAKRDINALSFDDLEQITISLLTQRGGNGSRVRTPLAEETSMRFDAVLVDEYQDTNPAQALIFEAISKNKENLFMVGDIKQAIYAFRNASPEDFEHKKESYAKYNMEAPVFPAGIALSANFRSREGVTDFVNFLFELVCTKTLGGTEYDERERLFAKGTFPDKSDSIADTELYFLTGDSGDEMTEQEAEFVATRIEKLMTENIRVPLKQGGTRPLNYSDIAVLSRSTKRLSARLRAAFDRRGIPLSAPVEDSFLDIYEVSVAVSLLRIIDNPYQDVPLVSVMASPVFGFSSDELALMRTESRSLPMYDALRRYCDSRGDKKCRAFLDTVEALRREASCCPVDMLLLKIYSMLSFPALMGGSKGNRVKSNLDRLVSYAGLAGGGSNKSLSAFLRYLDRLTENGFNVPTAASSGDDGVKIMTIHGSKGLEFPVVIVAGNGKFNTSDSTDRYLVHSKLGFGGRIREGNVSYSTVQRDIISRRVREEQVSEELRVLYVALTRAAERLIVVSSVSSLKKKISDCRNIGDFPELLKEDLADAASFADWLLPAACLHPCGDRLCAFGDIPPQSSGRRESRNVFIAAAEDVNSMPMPEYAKADEETAEFNEAQYGTQDYEPFDEKMFDWQYPYAEELSLPTKVSASGVSHGDYSQSAISVRPSFVKGGGEVLSGAEKGTAVHLFMSLYDFSSAETAESQLKRLEEEGKLESRQAQAVDITVCEAFIKSELGRKIAIAAERGELLREYGFSFRVAPSFILGFENSDKKVLVSGTADLIFFENGTPVIVDFKTDRVKAEEELLDRYALQLRLYSQAARSLWGAEPKAYIWSFALNRAISVPLVDSFLNPCKID